MTTEPRPDSDDALAVDDLELLMRGAFGSAAQRAEHTAEDAAIVLPDRYRMLGEVGRGGVGIVFEAEDLTLGRRIAVKVLQAHHRRAPMLVAKFESEGRIGAQLQHPGILSVLDVGRTGDDRPFFTMRLLPGDTLASRLALRDADSPQLATWLPVFARVCEAVGYAHTRGVVHRDLKPGNVLVGSYGEVLVTDWGMARLADAADASSESGVNESVTLAPGGAVVSRTGSLWGTPAYMAPEQACGAPDAATPRADVFGLGAILCQLLTGEPPFTGTPEVVLVQARLGDLAEAEARLASCGAPAELVTLTRQCLAVDPLARPADALKVAAVVQQHLAAVEERAHAAALAAAAAEARAAADRRLRRSQATWFATVLVLLLAGGVAWALWQQRTAVRAARDARAVELALDEGRSRWREAVQRGEATDWRVVAVAADTAVRLAAAGDVDADLRSRAQAFAAEAAGETAAAERRAAERASDLALRERIDDLNSRQWFDHDLRAKEAGYAALFAELGMDPTRREAADVAAAVRAHRLAEELALAFDRWAATCGVLGLPAERIQAVRGSARRVDADALRERLRDLIESPDVDAVREIVATMPWREVSTASVLLLSDAAAAAGERDLAHEVLEIGQLEHPTDFVLASVLAQRCDERGDAAGVVRFAAAAVALRPDAWHAGTRLAASLSLAGKHAQAERLFRRVAERHAHEPELWHNVGAALDRQGRYEESIVAMQRAEATGGSSSVTAMMRGRAARGLRRFDEAKQWYATAAARDPTSPDPWVRLGAMLCDDLRDYPNALAAFDRALAIGPTRDDALRNRAVVLDFLGRGDDAREQWQRVAARSPQLAEPHFKMALAAFRAKQLAAVLPHAFEAVRLSPQYADAWYLLGTTLGDLDEPRAAVAALRCAVKANARHAAAWHDLGWMLVDDAATRAEAIACYRRAIAEGANDANSHYNLAYALFLAEDWQGSRDAVEAALQRDPDHGRARELREKLPRE